nr:MAG TPA: hypothetical protein [Caudoviricetes sp.]
MPWQRELSRINYLIAGKLSLMKRYANQQPNI